MTDAAQGPFDDPRAADPWVDDDGTPPDAAAAAGLEDRSPVDDALAPILTEGDQVPGGPQRDIDSQREDSSPEPTPSGTEQPSTAPATPTTPILTTTNADDAVAAPDRPGPPPEDVQGDGDRVDRQAPGPEADPASAAGLQAPSAAAGAAPVLPPPAEAEGVAPEPQPTAPPPQPPALDPQPQPAAPEPDKGAAAPGPEPATLDPQPQPAAPEPDQGAAAPGPEGAAPEPEPATLDLQPQPAAPEPDQGAAAPGPEGGGLAPPGTEAAGPEAEVATRRPQASSSAGLQAPSAAAGAAPVLPPPPPELAEVPSDAGRIVAGRVQAVRGDDVIVALDDGRTGVINVRNLGASGDIAAEFPVGSAIEGAVLARSDPQHRVVLSRTWALKKRAWEAVVQAAAENQLLTGRVVSVGGKGVVVDVGVRGFVPASHLELGSVGDLQSYAGAELTLRVLDVDADRERLVLSRRSLLLREQRKSAHDVLSSIVAGEVRRGRVTSVSDYGAFVDLGGVSGLVHLSELSWHRVRHPSEVVSVGDEVDVKVLDVKVKKRRVSLSIRQLADDPLSGLTPGEIRTGPVTRLVDFGAFVNLDGVEGLVHLSELAEYRVSAPEEVVAPGEEVRVKVLSVDRRRRRIELSIRQAAEYGG